VQPDAWTLIIKRSSDSIWNRLIEHVSGPDYTLLSLNKEAGTMRIAFSSSDATEYVESGYLKSGWPVNRSWAPIVTSSIYLNRLQDCQNVWLDGQAFIQVQPVDDSHHMLKVNAEYQVTAKLDSDGQVAGIENWTFSTNTRDANFVNREHGMRVMQPSHKVERGLLSAVSR